MRFTKVASLFTQHPDRTRMQTNISIYKMVQSSSVQFSCSVVSDSLRPHELQHTRPLCPSPTSRVYSNSCPSSRWCHLAIWSSVIPRWLYTHYDLWKLMFFKILINSTWLLCICYLSIPDVYLGLLAVRFPGSCLWGLD